MISQLDEEKSFLDINVEELHALGYTHSEISTAFSWLVDKVDVTQEKEMINPALITSQSFRVLHEGESGIFTKESWGRLINLNSIGLLTNDDIEKIIEQAIVTGYQKISEAKLSNMITEILATPNPHGDKIVRTSLTGNDTIH